MVNLPYPKSLSTKKASKAGKVMATKNVLSNKTMKWLLTELNRFGQGPGKQAGKNSRKINLNKVGKSKITTSWCFSRC